MAMNIRRIINKDEYRGFNRKFKLIVNLVKGSQNFKNPCSIL